MKAELTKRLYLESFLSDDNGQLERKASNLTQVFLDAVSNDSISQLWTEFQDEPAKFEALSNYLRIPEDKGRQKVYYYAVMRTLITLTSELKSRGELQRDMSVYAGYRYIYPVLELLYQYDTVSRRRIQETLGLSSNSLSNFMKRTREFGLWKDEKEGRHLYYTITYKGKNVYKGLKKEALMKEKTSFDQLLIVLLDDIRKESDKPQPDADEIIMDLNRRFGELALFSSPALKFKLRTFFMRQNLASMKRMEAAGMKFQGFKDWGEEGVLSEYLPAQAWSGRPGSEEDWRSIMIEQEEYDVYEG